MGDSAWTCTTYDGRGRVTSTTDSSGKTTSFSYGVADRVTETAVDSDSVTRTTVSKVDWLGRPVSYTDEWGTVTRSTFDQAGRLVATHRTFAGGAETQLTARAYEASTGRLLSQTEFVSGAPRTTTFGYNAAGQPTTVTRPNGVVTTTGYDTTRGWVTTLSNKTPTGPELSQWTYGRSTGGSIASETANTLGRTRNFGFDGAGRLTGVGGTTARAYAYDADTNRCANAATCATPTFTYDNADRLTSSPEHSAYAYDAHGNMTSATPRTQPGAVPVADAFSFDSLNGATMTPRAYPMTVGQNGTVNATFDWTNTGTLSTSGWDSGSLGSGASTSTQAATMPMAGDTHLKASLTWHKTLTRPTTYDNVTLAAGSSNTAQVTTDDTGDITSTMDWSVLPKTWTGSGSATNSPTATTAHEGTFTASGNGKLLVELAWTDPTADFDLFLYNDTTGQLLFESKTIDPTNLRERIEPPGGITDLGSYPSARTYRYRVTAKLGTSGSFNLSGEYPVTPTMNLQLEKPLGTVVATSTPVAGLRRRTLTKTAATAGTYYLRATSSDFASTPQLSTTYSKLDWANVTLALKNNTNVLATVSSASGSLSLGRLVEQSEPLTGNPSWQVTNNSPALSVPTFALNRSTLAEGRETSTGSMLPSAAVTRTVVAETAGYAGAKVVWNPSVAGYANLTLALKNGATTIAQTTSSSGTATLPSTAGVPGAGSYTVSVTNSSATRDVPSYTLTTWVPQVPAVTADVVLKNASGTAVATATGAKPKTLSASVSPGVYSLVVTPTAGKADATLSGNYPTYANRYDIAYDANDHAVRIDDGQTVVAETLSPSGRVLRRVVSNVATGVVSEDTVFGYSDSGDSPAYSRPTAGGTVTTYLGDVVYTGTTGKWQITNLHGDVVGTTDGAGAFTATPPTDEFGVGQAPADRLGWLGGHDRFSVGGTLGLIRMGVRLYDPDLGRFLSVDPVEGGNANDYVYPADPVNNFDLDGQICFRCLARRLNPFAKGNRHLVMRDGKPGFHWRGHQARIEWSKSHGWHYNSGGGHHSVLRGLRDAAGRGISNAGRGAGRAARGVARGVVTVTRTAVNIFSTPWLFLYDRKTGCQITGSCPGSRNYAV